MSYLSETDTMAEEPQMLRPVPRRTFEITPASDESSSPSSPTLDSTNPDLLEAKLNAISAPSRTRSIMNLTSSTLYGIYSPTGYQVSRDEPTTPWGTGAQTPSHRRSQDEQVSSQLRSRYEEHSSGPSLNRPRSGFRGYYLPTILRTVLLLGIGMGYGAFVKQLHTNQKLAPVKLETIDRLSWKFLLFWGFSAVALGTLQPWLDSRWSESAESIQQSERRKKGRRGSSTGDMNYSRVQDVADWMPVVRSVGAFVGIAFAIRKVPWQSTMQVSMTLALVNPVLWFLVDRSKAGLLLSTFVGIVGTSVLFIVNPEILPSPAITPLKTTGNTTSVDGALLDSSSLESVAIWTWIASVLFCSCVCFGNIGRRLAMRHQIAVT